MDDCASLSDLDDLHARLLWPTLSAAAAAVLLQRHNRWPVEIAVELRELPDSGSDTLELGIDGSTISAAEIERVMRTFDAVRLVEMAAIAVTGVVLYYGGQREICDVSLRGSAADYLVGETQSLLEIAGRSRRSDLEYAWQEKLQRLRAREARDFYIAAIEFETPSARLGFYPE